MRTVKDSCNGLQADDDKGVARASGIGRMNGHSSLICRGHHEADRGLMRLGINRHRALNLAPADLHDYRETGRGICGRDANSFPSRCALRSREFNHALSIFTIRRSTSCPSNALFSPARAARIVCK